MHTAKKCVFKTMTFYVRLFFFGLFVNAVNASHKNTAENPDGLANRVNLSDNYVVEWTINETAKSVLFKVSVAVDDKGWVLLGFMPVPRNKSEVKNNPPKLSDTRGDFVVTWPTSASERRTLDMNTINSPGVLEEDRQDKNKTELEYHVTVQTNSKNTSSRSVLFISRKLDTGNPQDVPITDQPMWMFGAYGNANDYIKNLSAITPEITDTLAVEEVTIVKTSNKKEDNKTPWHKVLKEQIKKHWITAVLAVSGVLTIVIIGAVYCCFRKSSGFKGKKVKMTFYKEDEDDEARVAFLHSRT